MVFFSIRISAAKLTDAHKLVCEHASASLPDAAQIRRVWLCSMLEIYSCSPAFPYGVGNVDKLSDLIYSQRCPRMRGRYVCSEIPIRSIVWSLFPAESIPWNQRA